MVWYGNNRDKKGAVHSWYKPLSKFTLPVDFLREDLVMGAGMSS